MKNTRREFLRGLIANAGAVAVLLVAPSRAFACLGGIWVVHCPYCGHNDTVTEGTCQHVCESCGRQIFNGSQVTVVCPNGHLNLIDTGDGLATSYACTAKGCGLECRRPEPKGQPSRPDVHDHH